MAYANSVIPYTIIYVSRIFLGLLLRPISNILSLPSAFYKSAFRIMYLLRPIVISEPFQMPSIISYPAFLGQLRLIWITLSLPSAFYEGTNQVCINLCVPMHGMHCHNRDLFSYRHITMFNVAAVRICVTSLIPH